MLPGFRDIVTTLIARAAAMAGPFGVSIITARVLGPEDRGHYFLIYSYAQIAAQIANLGLHSSNTFLAANRRDLVAPLIVNGVYVACLSAPLAALAVVLLADRPDLLGLSAPAGGSAGVAAFLAVLIAPLIVVFLYLTNMAVTVGRIQLFNGLTILAGAAAIAAAVVAAVTGASTPHFLLAAAVAVAVSCLAGGRLLLAGEPVGARFDLPLFRMGVSYAFRAYLATLLGFLMMRIGVLALQQEASFDEIGQFSIAMQITDALITIPGMIGLLLFPALVRTEVDGRWQALWRVFWRLGALMLVLLGTFALVAPWLTVIMFGQDYAPAVPLILAMLPSVLVISQISMLSQYLAAEGFPWRQVWAWIAGFAVQTYLSFLLAERWGGVGIALALLLSSALVFVVLLTEAFAAKKRSAGKNSSPRTANTRESKA